MGAPVLASPEKWVHLYLQCVQSVNGPGSLTMAAIIMVFSARAGWSALRKNTKVEVLQNGGALSRPCMCAVHPAEAPWVPLGPGVRSLRVVSADLKMCWCCGQGPEHLHCVSLG